MNEYKVATFRQRFTELLESCNKSRSQIAQEFHVAKQTISAWTTGQTSPRLPVIMSLADYFDVNFRWLLGFDVPKTPDHVAAAHYDQYVLDTLKAQHDLGMLLDVESNLILSFRSLSPRGQDLLLDRAEELKLLYGKKTPDDSVESV
jgi:transcriptional regulator with XRE-family HTH domain